MTSPKESDVYSDEAKEYPCGVFTLSFFPGDQLKRLPNGKYRLVIEPKDKIARENGQRSRRELYARLDFHVALPRVDVISSECE